jgi:hypothetical protein
MGQSKGEGSLPLGTFEKTSFEQILAQYNEKHKLPPTVELAQAYIMT